MILIAVGLAFCGAIAFIVSNAKGTAFETLWSNLDASDGGAIVAELERQSIPYRLEDGGRTIKIPAGEVHRTRLSFAAQGLPSSGVVGFESIGSNSIWATDFERKVQYVRALSGELTRTVKSISGVLDARVHIVLPEPTVFAVQQRPATAAVLVKVSPMNELNPASVRGIVNLVARSVEGLSPSEVTVMDSQGRLLSDEYESGGPGSISTVAFELTSNVEKGLEKRLVSLLTPVVGPGNVVCQVKADLNLDQVKTLDTIYTAEPEGILRSSQEATEVYQGTEGLPGGQAGGLDVPTYATGQTGESTFERIESTRNYEVGQKTVETIVTPGAIKSLSVALLVNKELDDEAQTMITESVTAALGLDPLRQDKISVTGVLFDRSLADKIDGSLEMPVPEFNKVYVYGAAVGLALVLGTLIIILTQRKRKNRKPEILEPEPLFLTQEVAVPPEVVVRQRTKESVERLARTNPGSGAALMKTWILEDER